MGQPVAPYAGEAVAHRKASALLALPPLPVEAIEATGGFDGGGAQQRPARVDPLRIAPGIEFVLRARHREGEAFVEGRGEVLLDDHGLISGATVARQSADQAATASKSFASASRLAAAAAIAPTAAAPCAAALAM